MASLTLVAPPVAEKIPHDVIFGKVEGQNRGLKPFPQQRTRTDNYFWMRSDDRKDEKVLAHLRQENAYSEQELSATADLRKILYEEHVSHLKETDDRAACRDKGFFYYSRTVKGLSYKLHCRKPVSGVERVPLDTAAEEILLDENRLAEGKSHCDVRSVKVSPDHSMLCYAVDYSGDEVYQLVIIDLATGEKKSDSVMKIAGSLQWGDDSTLFYLTQDAQLRPYRMWRHILGTDSSTDVLLFEEKDEMFWLGLDKSSSGRFIFAASGSSETSEFWFLDLKAKDAHTSSLTCIQPRTFGLRYDCEHDGNDGFLISTNKDDAINNRLMLTNISTPSADNWKEIIPYDSTRKIAGLKVFLKHVVMEGRQNGLTQLWIMDKDQDGSVLSNTLRQVTFDEELYETGISTNKEYDTTIVRIHYSSLTTPTQWLDLDMNDMSSKILVKEQAVLNFDRSLYVCKRVFATAPDKTKIPMSIVHRKDLYDIDEKEVSESGETKENESSSSSRIPKPTMLYGYGSYGICIDPGFHKLILPYLDRGMIYCIAHIRGGGEMGRYWYEEQGKYLNKRNTFQDFISCAEHLIDNNYTKPSLLAAEGRSAGGLLIGNVINWRPDLFEAVVAGVPFVDLMNTMCDPTIPLTTGEWEEWGNPNEDKYFDYMLSYSPYDNVRKQPYPNVLITAGLYDPRVAYWEPAKWASKLREMKIDNGKQILCKFDLDRYENTLTFLLLFK
jgi:oligopeptidase B